MSPKVSVLIPIYNVQDYISKCLESVLSNTIINQCEVILWNDCSSDNTMQIIQELLTTKYKDIQQNVLIKNNEYNMGVAATRNFLIKEASGDYLAFIDSDDWVEKNYLEKLYNQALTGDYDIVGCWRYDEYKKHTFQSRDNFSNDIKVNITNLIKGNLFAGLPCRLLRRQVIIENELSFVNGKNMGEDGLFLLKFLNKSNYAELENSYLYHYNRMNQTSLCTVNNEILWANRVDNINAMINYIDAEKIDVGDALLHMKANVMLLAMISDNSNIRKQYSNFFPEATEYLSIINCSRFAKIYSWCYLKKHILLCYLFRKIKKVIRR